MIKSKQSSGMNSFLKTPNPNLNDLKKQYFEQQKKNVNSAFEAPKQEFKHWSDIERYIDKQKRQRN